MADFYTCVEVDELEYTDLDEAVEGHLDYLEPVEDWPEELAVLAYRRVVVSAGEQELFAELALEEAIERLDEEFGNPDSATDVTDGMKKAAVLFIETVLEEYNVWRCVREPQEDQTVPVAKWVREHAPQWMVDKKIAAQILKQEKHGEHL